MKQYHLTKRLTAMLLALVMVFGMLPVNALAEGANQTGSQQTEAGKTEETGKGNVPEAAEKNSMDTLDIASLPAYSGSGRHGYLQDLDFSDNTTVKESLGYFMDYKFDPNVSAYELYWPGSARNFILCWKAAEGIETRGKYICVYEYNQDTGKFERFSDDIYGERYRSGLGGSYTWLGSSSKNPRPTLNQSRLFRVAVGVGKEGQAVKDFDPDAEGSECDFYYFRMHAKLNLSNISIRDKNNETAYYVLSPFNNGFLKGKLVVPQDLADSETVELYSLGGGTSGEIRINGEILENVYSHPTVCIGDCPRDQDGKPYIDIWVRYTKDDGTEYDDPQKDTHYSITFDGTNAPRITTQPEEYFPSNKIVVGKDSEVYAKVEAEPVNGGTLSYMWKYQRTAKNPAEGSTYLLETSKSTNGWLYYYCQVTNTVDGVAYTVNTKPIYVKVSADYLSEPVWLKDSSSCNDAEYSQYDEPAKLWASFSIPDSGATATHQWFVNTEPSTEGARAIQDPQPGASGNHTNIIMPDTSKAGTYYYYCVCYSTMTLADGTVATVSARTDFIRIHVKGVELELQGDGSEESPYLIFSGEDMAALKQTVNEGASLQNRYVKLMADITLPEDWDGLGALKEGATTPFGSTVNPFAATIDGDGHTVTIPAGCPGLVRYARTLTVKNLNIYGEAIKGSAVVFDAFTDYGNDDNYNTGCPWTADVENVTLKKGSQTGYGGMVYGSGSGANTVTVRNCTVESGVVIGGGGSFVGYLNGSIENCRSAALVKGGGSTGGIAGSKGQSMGSCKILNCAFTGTISSTGNKVGGILGSGYGSGSGSAPNTPVPTIRNCLVAATITGGDMVGGIYGAEPECENCWANGKGSIENNVFYGEVHATGERIGAIAGFYKSFNSNQTFDSCYYLDTCGADRAIGEVEILSDDAIDPNAFNGAVSAKEMADGSLIDKLNDFEGGYHNWIQGEKYPELSEDPVAYALTVTGEFKKECLVGEKLDLTGAVITALWTDGRTEVLSPDQLTISGFDSSTNGTKKVTLSYGAASTEIVILVKRPKGTIDVTFTLLGDSVHDKSQGPHTLKGQNLSVWVETKSCTIDNNATVKDLFEQVLSENGLSWVNSSGNYIESVTYQDTTLEEFTNGKNSGWMYTLNGVHVGLGVSEQYLNDGDAVVFHYTDDYTKESPIGVEVLYGDADEDNRITVLDALAVLKYTVGSRELDAGQIRCADVNGDGDADVEDALQIIKKVAGSLKVFPAEEAA